MTAPEDFEALRWLCTHQTELRDEATNDGWLPAFESAMSSLRSGVPAGTVRQRVEESRQADGHLRAGAGGDLMRNIDHPVEVWPPRSDQPLKGHFACPRALCDVHRIRDANGYEPLCVDGRPMDYREGAGHLT